MLGTLASTRQPPREGWRRNWPGIKDGLMTLHHAQFEALLAGLDWHCVRAVETRAPELIE